MADTQCEGPPEKRQRSEIDCQQCGLVKSKYTCPKCAFRTCSLPCVKLHKEANNCDGQRKPFDVVKKFSQFNDNISVKDQEYLSTLKSAVSGGIQSTNIAAEQFRNSNTAIATHIAAPSTAAAAANISNVSSAMDDHHNATADTSISSSFRDESEESMQTSFTPGAHSPVKTAFTPGAQSFTSNNNNSVERFLVSSASRRHIFLNSPSECDGSRHEQFSDTIIWTISLKFLQEVAPKDNNLEAPQEEEQQQPTIESLIDDTGDLFHQINGFTTLKQNDILEYDCTARSIPENLTVQTLIRQFVKPKQFGTVVSKKDLDEEKMQAFWDAGLDGVLVFMKVPIEDKERYYMVDKSKTVLDNLRNRFINGHPKFIVILSNQFQQWQTLSEMEAQELHDKRRQENKTRHQQEGGNNHRGGGRGGHNNNHRGNHRGGGFRGGRGGGGFHQRGGGRGRGRGGGGNNRSNNNGLGPRDLSDIFEPFPSNPTGNARISRPNYSSTNNKEDAGVSGWASAVNKRSSVGTSNDGSSY